MQCRAIIAAIETEGISMYEGSKQADAPGADVFWVPAENMAKLRERIAKLNARAAKLGCEPISIAVGEPAIQEKHRDIQTADGWIMRSEKAKSYPVTVAGSPPKFDGWTFLGTVQLIDGENIVRAVPGAAIPMQYRAATDWCDHCRSHRGRKDVFVVQHESGETKIIGRNCIADFLGHENPESITWKATILASLRDEFGGFERLGGGRWQDMAHPLDAFAAAAACAIRHFGFHASQSESATKRTAGDIMFPPRPQHDRQGNRIDWREGFPVPPTPSDEDLSVAAAAIAWAESIPCDTPNDYLSNLRAIAINGCIDQRGFGISASLPQAYLREIGKAAERKRDAERNAESQYFGTPKKREIFELTCEKAIGYCGRYGDGDMYLFRDARGNIAKWATTSGDLTQGATYRIKATVKEHAEYKGARQTVLSRCEVIEKVERAT